MTSDKDLKEIEDQLEYRRIRRKCLIDSWMEGAYSSEELHRLLNEEH